MSSLPLSREFRNVFRHRIVHPDFAFLHQLHDRRGSGDDFGERCDVKNRICGHGLAARLQRAIAESFAIDHLSVVPDQQHGAGNLAVVNGVEDDGIENAEVGGCLGGARCRCGRGRRAGASRSKAGKQHDRDQATRIQATNCPS